MKKLIVFGGLIFCMIYFIAGSAYAVSLTVRCSAEAPQHNPATNEANQFLPVGSLIYIVSVDANTWNPSYPPGWVPGTVDANGMPFGPYATIETILGTCDAGWYYNAGFGYSRTVYSSGEFSWQNGSAFDSSHPIWAFFRVFNGPTGATSNKYGNSPSTSKLSSAGFQFYPVGVTTNLNMPMAAGPAYLVGTGESTTSIKWSWGSVGGSPTTYQLCSSDGTLIQSVDATLFTSTVETGLASGDAVYVRKVRAIISGSLSTFSPPGTSYTQANAPIKLIANGGWNSMNRNYVMVSWEANGNKDTVKYRLYDRTNTGTVDGATTGYYTTKESGLNPTTAYTYEVRAINSQNIITISTTTSEITPPGKVDISSATALSTSEIQLTWQPTLDGQYYLISWEGTPVVTTDATRKFSGLLASSCHVFTVEAFSAAHGFGEPSNATSEWTWPQTPPQPTGETGSSSYCVHLWWMNDINDIATYYIQYSPDGSTWTTTESGTTGNTYLFNTQADSLDNKMVWFRVMAKNGAGDVSGYSTPASFETKFSGNYGPAPTYLIGTGESISSIRWTWQPSIDATAYEICDEFGNFIATEDGQSNNSTLEINIPGGPNTSETITVRSIGNRVPSTSIQKMQYTLSKMPSMDSAAGGWKSTNSSYMTVSWEANGNPSTVQYRLYDITRGVTVDGALSGAGATFSTSESSLNPATAYTYEVRAYNSDNVSTKSATTVMDWTPPGKVVVYSGGATGSSLTWYWASTVEADRYNARQDSSNGYTGFQSVIDADPTTVATFGALLPCRRYSITVEAVSNAYGTGEPSSQVSKWTLPTTPISMTGETASGMGNIDLFWTGDTNEVATYEVAWAYPTAGDLYTAVATIGAGVKYKWALNIPGKDDQTVWVKIRAKNVDGDTSPWNTAISVLTGFSGNYPPAPTWEVGTGESTSSIRWTWAPSTDANAYELYSITRNLLIMTVEGQANNSTLETGIPGGPNTSETLAIRCLRAGPASLPIQKIQYTLAQIPVMDWARGGWNGTNKTYMNVSWETVTNPLSVQYRLYNVTLSGTVDGALTGTGVLSTIESNLASTNAPYTYEVRAYNSDNVATKSATAMDWTPPGKIALINPDGVTTNEIIWYWTSMAGANRYNMRLDSSGSPAYTPSFESVANVAGTTVGTFDGLTPSRSYNITVEAVSDANGTGEPSSTYSKVTSPQIPVTPTGEAGIPQESVNLYWHDDINYSAVYEIQWAPKGSTAFATTSSSTTAAQAKNSIGFQVAGQGNNYLWFRLRAKNGEGVWSLPSGTVEVYVTPGTQTYMGPTWEVGTAETTSSIHWTWAAVSGASKYELWNATTGTRIVTVDSVPMTQTTEGIVPTTPNTPATREVRALINTVWSDYGNSLITKYTLAQMPIMDWAMGGWKSTNSSYMTVSWEANGNPSTVQNRLYNITLGGTVDGVLTGTGVLSTTESNLPSTNAPYTYEVRAYNSDGVITRSATAMDWTPPGKISPVNPDGVTTNEIIWYWTSVAGANRYNMRLDSSGAPAYSSIESVANVPTTTVGTFDGLTPSRSYNITAEAVSDANGTGEPSATYSKWTSPQIPVTPTGETYNPQSDSVSLYWASDPNYFAIYEVQWALKGSTMFTAVTTTAAQAKNTITQVTSHGNDFLWFRIRAKNGENSWSLPSGTVEVYVSPGSQTYTGPTWEVGTAETTSTIHWTWAAVSGASKYELWNAATNTRIVTMDGASKTDTVEGILPATPNTPATREVRALINTLWSDYGNSLITKYTLAARPNNISAKGSWEAAKMSNVIVMWGPNSNPGTVLYRVYNVTKAATYDGATNGTTLTEPNLYPNTPYTYEVRAYNSNDVSTRSATAVGWTPPGKVLVTVGSVETDNITWTWASTLGATSYNVRMDGTVVSTDQAALPSCKFTGLTPSSRHFVTVEAVSADYGTGEPSTAVQKWALPAVPPEPVGGPSYVAGEGYFDAYWIHDTNINAVYSLMIAATPEGPYTERASNLPNMFATAVPTPGLTTDAYGKVSAKNGEGVTSEYSAVGHLTGGYVPPGPTYPGPMISQVKFDGRPYIVGALVSSRPKITAIVTGDVDISKTANAVIVDEGSSSQIVYPASDVTYEVAPGYSGLPYNAYLLTATSRVPIPAQPVSGHMVRIYSWMNTTGGQSYWAGAVAIMSGGVQVVGNVYNYPNPFKPLSADPSLNRTRVAYNLSVDANITLIIYDMTGHEVHRMTYHSGAVGGQAGINSVEWNGRSMFGEAVGNGMYIYKIVTGDKVIGTGKLVVYD